MKSSNKYSVRFFPFSPGIPWKVKYGKYIIPEINSESWDLALHGRNAVVLADGGLVETFISLTFLEALNNISPGTKLYWAGNDSLNSLVSVSGLASMFPKSLPGNLIERFPVPIFLDRKDNTYFNCLLNYIRVKPYYGGKSYHDRKAIIKQIFRNSLVDWDSRFIPQQRRADMVSTELNRWAKSSKFYFNKPYVCLFPETKHSIHKQSTLGWSNIQIKSFAAMLRQAGVSLVLFTNSKTFSDSCFVLPPRPDYEWFMMPAAKAVLSETIDYLIVAGMISKAKLIGLPTKNELSISKNNKYIGAENVIYTLKGITPMDAFNFVCAE